MKILAIETSCDETAVSILECSGDISHPQFNILGNALYSQIKIHERYGGVFPALAKREHALNLIPLFKKALQESNLETQGITTLETDHIFKLLEREPELARQFVDYIPTINKPEIDAIAVTAGPGLEPALWVGINFAKALGIVWNIPVYPINHMEGHILSVLTQAQDEVKVPALALLISGGHTELVHVENWLSYNVIGETKDDAVGEAFDKVARVLGLPYPGGPRVSALAQEAREKELPTPFPLPRPMLHSKDFAFSFSGLKTAVLYGVRNNPDLTEDQKKGLAKEFEDAVTEVLTTKTKKAIDEYNPCTLILGGGVIANSHIRNAFLNLEKKYPELKVLIPEMNLTTDNSMMIGIAGYLNYIAGKSSSLEFKAQGNLRLN